MFQMADQQKILIVEDNDFVRMQVVRYLADAGFRTSEAKDGNEALKVMGQDISLAIVDMRMEPMGGLDFVRALRGNDNTVPVIFMTGDQGNDLLEQASKWGVDAVLLKPVMKERLVKAVQRSLAAQGRAS
jgi:CheY-like chemotaxis protein